MEDELLLRQSVAEMLSKAGFSIVEASDGDAALEAIEAYGNSLDVLFLDITIPEHRAAKYLRRPSGWHPESE